jgi:hypothetical protein
MDEFKNYVGQILFGIGYLLTTTLFVMLAWNIALISLFNAPYLHFYQAFWLVLLLNVVKHRWNEEK